MNELPEIMNLERQVLKYLAGKRIAKLSNSNSPHKFAFFTGNPLDYGKLLQGRSILSAKGAGIFLDIICEGDVKITSGDGANLRYGGANDSRPKKYQLMLEFDDGCWLAYTIAMYGSIGAYEGANHGKYYRLSTEAVSPLSKAFHLDYFAALYSDAEPKLSAKAFLATQQRIPGIGNGVVQDILFNSGMHPKRMIGTMSGGELARLFKSLKETLKDMADNGGRDTESDLLGNEGGYKTVLSKKTCKSPCPKCKGPITKEAYLGGSVYYCKSCQPFSA